jgi:DNA-binding NtrC family response regulator
MLSFQNAFGSLMPRRQSGGARRAVYELLAITPDTGFFAALQYAATAHGWTVRWARSVNAAIGVLTCRAITVILYDWCSATEDWTESIDRLKLIAEGPSIVLAAGRVDEELWREALSLRVYDVVSRAGQFEHLFATLRFARKWKSERRDLAGIG